MRRLCQDARGYRRLPGVASPSARCLEIGCRRCGGASRVRGRIERTLESGHLDSERYLWRTTTSSPFDEVALPEDDLDLYTHFGEVFFRSAGLGSRDDFADWAGIGKRAASSVMERLELTEVEIEGADSGHRLALSSRLEAVRPASLDGASALPFIDNLIELQGGPGSLTRSQYQELEVPMWGSGKPSTLGTVRHMFTRALVVDGRIVGFWEYDPDSGNVHTAVFDRTESSVDDVVADEARALGDFIRDQLGHGKSYSLDTDDALRGRIARLREAFPVVE